MVDVRKPLPPLQRHVALADYLQRNRISMESERSDGALVVVYDRQYRVYFYPAQHGDVVLEALGMAMEYWDESAETLALAADERSLLLQRRVSEYATLSEFEQALEDFLNSLASWRRELFVL
jgi:hypothetical protein